MFVSNRLFNFVSALTVLVVALTEIAGQVPLVALMERSQEFQGTTVGSSAYQLDMIRALDTADLRPVIDVR
jgi:hypothetical protein